MSARTSQTDQERFRAVFDLAHPRLVAYARRRTTSPGDADDLVAEVLLVAWRRLDELPAGEAVVSWLYAVAWRMLSNQRRGRQRRDALQRRLGDQAGSQPAVEDVTEALVVREALSRLPSADQELLRLHAWEALSHAEIAAVLGISTNAVAIRLHRARERLAAQLDRKAPAVTGQIRRGGPDEP